MTVIRNLIEYNDKNLKKMNGIIRLIGPALLILILMSTECISLFKFFKDVITSGSLGEF